MMWRERKQEKPKLKQDLCYRYKTVMLTIPFEMKILFRRFVRLSKHIKTIKAFIQQGQLREVKS